MLIATRISVVILISIILKVVRRVSSIIAMSVEIMFLLTWLIWLTWLRSHNVSGGGGGGLFSFFHFCPILESFNSCLTLMYYVYRFLTNINSPNKYFILGQTKDL